MKTCGPDGVQTIDRAPLAKLSGIFFLRTFGPRLQGKEKSRPLECRGCARRQMRHTRASTTLDIYRQIVPAGQRRAAQRFSKYVKQGSAELNQRLSQTVQ